MNEKYPKYNINKKYEILKILGEGAEGVVYLAKDKNNNYVAVKKIKLREGYSLAKIMDEVNFLKKISQNSCVPNIVCYKEVFLSKKNDNIVYLVTDYIEGEDK